MALRFKGEAHPFTTLSLPFHYPFTTLSLLFRYSPAPITHESRTPTPRDSVIP